MSRLEACCKIESGSIFADAISMKSAGESYKPICIIPARGGSKRIVKKNIKTFCEKPMIQWSIEAAIDANCFSSILVSTDSSQIASIARALGARIPFMRPSELADDHTITIDVIKHAIEYLKQSNMLPVNEHTPVCCLYATAPFTQPSDLAESLERLTDTSFVIPVTSFAFPVQRASGLSDEGKLSMFYPEHVNTRSQDLVEAYHDAGQFYWGTANTWCTAPSMYATQPAGYLLPRWRVQDIDTPEDWDRAEYLFAAIRQQATGHLKVA